MGTEGLLIEDEPKDWYIEENGAFCERGRAEAQVEDCICVQTSMPGKPSDAKPSSAVEFAI